MLQLVHGSSLLFVIDKNVRSRVFMLWCQAAKSSTNIKGDAVLAQEEHRPWANPRL